MKLDMGIIQKRERELTRARTKWNEKWDAMNEEERNEFLRSHPGLAKRLRVSQVDLSGWNKKAEKENEK